MCPVRTLSEQELRHGGAVLRYEIEMLIDTSLALERWSLGSGTLHNAVLEAFLVHMRQLIEFLVEQGDGRHGRDLRAAHFCDPSLQSGWRDRNGRLRTRWIDSKRKDDADRQVVHLTAERGGPHKTAWPIAQIRTDMLTDLSAFAEHFGCLLDAPIRKWLIGLGPRS